MTMTGPYPTREPDAAAATGASAAAGGTALLIAGGYSGSVWSLIFGAVAMLAAVYEFIAIYSDDVPTITEGVKGGGWPLRIAAIALGSLALFDHFGPGWVL